MQKTLNFVIITGFLIVSSLMVIFSTTSNQVFGIEYSTYTREKMGIEFQYPSDLELDEDDGSIPIYALADKTDQYDTPIFISKYEGQVEDSPNLRMKLPKYICAKCRIPFTRRWNANRHCNNKHSGAIEDIISFTEYITKHKHSSIPLNDLYEGNNSPKTNVKNQLFYDNQISANNDNLAFNTMADPFDIFIENELSPYKILEPLSWEYEEMQRLLDSFPEPQKQVLRCNALVSAINSENPKESMHKKLLEYRKMKSSIMMLNDLAAHFGRDKEYIKEFLKLKLKSKQKI